MVDFELLARVGLSQYERLTLIGILGHGVTDAATLCEDGDIPTSKVYLATEKLEKLGLITIQRTRPRLFAALSTEAVIARLGELAREEAEAFAQSSRDGLIQLLENQMRGNRSRNSFADVALGSEQHVRRHLAQLASAKHEIVSYLETPDIHALRVANHADFNVLRRIRKNLEASGAQHRIVFGFNSRDAPFLISFLNDFRSELRLATGVRYSGVLGHPFHVVDGKMVILSLDNPFLAERRVASFLIEDADIASALQEGFSTLWQKAMKSLTEIDVHPGALRK